MKPKALRFPTLSLVLALALPAVAAEKPPPVYVPDAEADEAPPLRDGTWVVEGAEHTLLLRRLEGDARLEYLERNTGFAIDPFAAPKDEQEPFLTFQLVVENRSKTPLELRPSKCWLRTNYNKIQTPLGMTDLRFDHRRLGHDFPPAYENAGAAVLEMPVTVRPGQAVSGLLVYRAVSRKTVRFGVDVELTSGNGDVIRFDAPYRRFKEDGKNSGKKNGKKRG